MKWILNGYVISLLIAFVLNQVHTRFLPRQDDVIPEITDANIIDDQKNLLDQINADKLECILKYIEQPGTKLQCVDKLFGDERSQLLLSELSNELAGDVTTEEDGHIGSNKQVDDQLVDDLDTLSKKSHIISTVEDEVPVINSDIQKRVEEQVDTPKDERRNPPIVAEIVKTDQTVDENDVDDDDADNEDAEDYEYDSSLVNKLYNMLQDLVLKETLQYGLNVDIDDNDSQEEEEEGEDQTANEIETATTDGEETGSEEDDEENALEKEEEEDDVDNEVDSNEGLQMDDQIFGANELNQAGSDSEEEEEEEEDDDEDGEEESEEDGQGVNEIVGADGTNVEESYSEEQEDEGNNLEDDIAMELERMQGSTRTDTDVDVGTGAAAAEEETTHNNGGSGEDEGRERDISQIENDLVKELDHMLEMAKQAVEDGDDQPPSTIDSDAKLLQDLQNLEQQLKRTVRRR